MNPGAIRCVEEAHEIGREKKRKTLFIQKKEENIANW